MAHDNDLIPIPLRDEPKRGLGRGTDPVLRRDPGGVPKAGPFVEVDVNFKPPSEALQKIPQDFEGDVLEPTVGVEEVEPRGSLLFRRGGI